MMRLDKHGLEFADKRGREAVLLGLQVARRWFEIGERPLRPDHSGLVERVFVQVVRRQPAYAVVFPNKLLEICIGEPHRARELLLEQRCFAAPVEDGDGKPEPPGGVGRGFRRNGLGVNRDRFSHLLQRARRRQPDDATTEYRDLPLAGSENFAGCKLGSPPRQCYARSAVAIVVDAKLVVEFLRLQAKTTGTERPQAHSGADFALGRD
jgi:hypothetical protein